MPLIFRILFPLKCTCIVLLMNSVAFCQTTEERVQLQRAIKHYQAGELETARGLLRSLSSVTANAEDTFRIQVHNNLGNVYADLGKNKEAVQAYTQALMIASNTENRIEIAKIRKNLGAVFMSLGRFNQAETYYLQALEIAINEKDLILQADCLNNLGTVYEQTARLEQAKEAYFNALGIYRATNKHGNIAMVSSNLALVFKAGNEIDSCIHYNLIAIQAAQDLKDTWMEAAIANNLGNLYGELGQIQQATSYLTRSLQLAQKINALEIEIMALESFSDAYARAGDYQKAFDYLKRMQKRQNVFNNLSLSKEIETLNIRFQTREKDLIAQQLKTKQRVTLWISSLVIFILLISGILGIILIRKRIREKHLINLHAVTMESETNARMALASDLHDNIGQKIAVLSMYTHHIPDRAEQEKIQGFIQNLGQEVRQLSHQLVPEAFKFGLERSLQELKNEIESTSTIRVDLACEPGVFDKFPTNTHLNLYRIVQETISNSLKHAQATQIQITAKQAGTHIELSIQDNGRGFDIKKLQKSEGIGWKSIEARIQTLGGSFQLASSETGTLLTLKIPFTKHG